MLDGLRAEKVELERRITRLSLIRVLDIARGLRPSAAYVDIWVADLPLEAAGAPVDSIEEQAAPAPVGFRAEIRNALAGLGMGAALEMAAFSAHEFFTSVLRLDLATIESAAARWLAEEMKTMAKEAS